MANYTNNRCYILTLKPPFERLDFQFVPQEIKTKRDVRLGSLEVVGRNLPLYHQTGGEESMSLTLEFYAEDDNRIEVMQKVEWLRALTYNDGIDGTPAQNIKIIFGDLFKDEVWVINSIAPTYSGFSSLYDFAPLQAKVELQLKLDMPKNHLKRNVLWRQ